MWRRFSELKKLHGELAYTHKNLFRRQEEFPPFPRAQVFGMMDKDCDTLWTQPIQQGHQVLRSLTVGVRQGLDKLQK